MLQSTFSGIHKSTLNLALGYPTTSEVTLGNAHGCHLEPGVGHGCDGRCPLDKATGWTISHRTWLPRGNAIQNRHGASEWHPPQVEGGIKELWCAAVLLPILGVPRHWRWAHFLIIFLVCFPSPSCMRIFTIFLVSTLQSWNTTMDHILLFICIRIAQYSAWSCGPQWLFVAFPEYMER